MTQPAPGDHLERPLDPEARVRRWAERDDLLGVVAERDQLRDRVAQLELQVRTCDESIARQADRIDQLTIELARATAAAAAAGRVQRAIAALARRSLRLARRVVRPWR